jgi:hypothetical protein
MERSMKNTHKFGYGGSDIACCGRAGVDSTGEPELVADEHLDSCPGVGDLHLPSARQA